MIRFVLLLHSAQWIMFGVFDDVTPLLWEIYWLSKTNFKLLLCFFKHQLSCQDIMEKLQAWQQNLQAWCLQRLRDVKQKMWARCLQLLLPYLQLLRDVCKICKHGSKCCYLRGPHLQLLRDVAKAASMGQLQLLGGSCSFCTGYKSCKYPPKSCCF